MTNSCTYTADYLQTDDSVLAKFANQQFDLSDPGDLISTLGNTFFTTESTPANPPFSAFNGTPTPTPTLTFDYAGNIYGIVNFNPLVVGLVGNYLGEELPLGVSINQDFQGSFCVPPDLLTSITTDLLDGEITIGLPFVLDALKITEAAPVIEALDDVFNVQFAGSGNLTSTTGTTDFTVEYQNDTNSFVIDGVNPLVVAGALSGPATMTAEADFSVDLVLSEFVKATNLLGITLPSDVSNFLTLSQAFGINEIELASGSISLETTTIPVAAPVTG
ncbi:hypothetical protein [Allocoleopsis sp.]|uniref:hypothetical protein n=1 Tax=Allocoleopsis sp. TaxID=3088169 RepID=UPI002FD0499B